MKIQPRFFISRQSVMANFYQWFRRSIVLVLSFSLIFQAPATLALNGGGTGGKPFAGLLYTKNVFLTVTNTRSMLTETDSPSDLCADFFTVLIQTEVCWLTQERPVFLWPRTGFSRFPNIWEGAFYNDTGWYMAIGLFYPNLIDFDSRVFSIGLLGTPPCCNSPLYTMCPPIISLFQCFKYHSIRGVIRKNRSNINTLYYDNKKSYTPWVLGRDGNGGAITLSNAPKNAPYYHPLYDDANLNALSRLDNKPTNLFKRPDASGLFGEATYVRQFRYGWEYNYLVDGLYNPANPNQTFFWPRILGIETLMMFPALLIGQKAVAFFEPAGAYRFREFGVREDDWNLPIPPLLPLFSIWISRTKTYTCSVNRFTAEEGGVYDPRCYDWVPLGDRVANRYKDNRADCRVRQNSGGDCTADEENQNFANYFQYHRNRLLLQTGQVLRQLSSMPFRVGLNGISSEQSSAGNSNAGAWFPAAPLTGNNMHKISMMSYLMRMDRPLTDNHSLRQLTDEVYQYFKSPADRADNPWKFNDGEDSSGFDVCRRSYHIITTDTGYRRDPLFDWVSLLNSDVTPDPVPKSKPIQNSGIPAWPLNNDSLVVGNRTVNAAPAIDDGWSNTLADYAYRAWAEDLQPAIANDKMRGRYEDDRIDNPKYTSDRSKRQNIVTSVLTYGDRRLVNFYDPYLNAIAKDPRRDFDEFDINNDLIKLGYRIDWPNVNDTDIFQFQNRRSQARIADLWHTSLAGYGWFARAGRWDEEKDFWQKFKLDDAPDYGDQPTKPAVTRPVYQGYSGQIFMSTYFTDFMWGDVTSYAIDAVPIGNRLKATFGNELWSADDKIDKVNWQKRKIYTWDRFDRKGKLFTPENISTVTYNLPGRPNINDRMLIEEDAFGNLPVIRWDKVVNYVRGDKSLEQHKLPKEERANGLRTRADPGKGINRVIGHIIKSTQIYVNDQDFAYDELPNDKDNTVGYASVPGQSYAIPMAPEVRNSYRDFVAKLRGYNGTSRPDDRPGYVFFAANDGMLHAANAKTGEEVFAYIPRAAYSSLRAYVDPSYNKQSSNFFIMDGSPTLSHAYVRGQWRAILTVTYGRGGFGFSVLDVTNLLLNGEFRPEDIWYEVTPETAYDPVIARTEDKTYKNYLNNTSIGYLQGDVYVLPANDGKWYIVTGNGMGDGTNAKRLPTIAMFDIEKQPGDDGFIKRIPGLEFEKLELPGREFPLEYGGTGMGSIAPVLDGRRTLQAVYAGDYWGNLYRANFRSTIPLSTPTEAWVLWGFPGNADGDLRTARPLFQADSFNYDPERNRSLINRPLISRELNGGYLVTFASGDDIMANSANNKTPQGVYTIWDGMSVNDFVTITEDRLIERFLLRSENKLQWPLRLDTSLYPDDVLYREWSKNAYTKGLPNGYGFGWKMLLPKDGSRVTENLDQFGSQLRLTVSAIDSSKGSGEEDYASKNPCGSTEIDQDLGGSGWMIMKRYTMFMNLRNGTALPYPYLDQDGDGKWDDKTKYTLSNGDLIYTYGRTGIWTQAPGKGDSNKRLPYPKHVPINTDYKGLFAWRKLTSDWEE